MPRDYPFSLEPKGALRAIQDVGHWHALEAPISFELVPEGRGFPSGWVLLSCRLTRAILDGSARLVVDYGLGGAEHLILAVPVSKTGQVRELVRLPPGVRRLTWLPSNLTGEFQHGPFVIRAVGRLERFWWMIRRVAEVLYLEPAAQRAAVGLSLWRSLADLEGAYRACGSLWSHRHELSYADWIARSDGLDERDRRQIHRQIGRLGSYPYFRILINAEGEGEGALETLRSLRGQLYRNFSVAFLDRIAGFSDALDPEFAWPQLGVGSRLVPAAHVAAFVADLAAELADAQDSEYLVILRQGDVLPEQALFWMASAIAGAPEADFLYSDEDSLDAQGRRVEPRFKPDWSPEHLRSTHYTGQLAVFRARALAGADLANAFHDGAYELALRIAETPAKVVHIPAVLCHRRPPPAALGPAQARALAAHLARRGVAADVAEIRPGLRRIRYRLPEAAPLVSIVVPTRDALALLATCVDSVLGRSTYRRFELLVVDNQSRRPETLAYLAALAGRPAVRVLRYDRPFNYAAINNFAVAEAQGEALVFLNNDIEVISPDWLEEMLGHLLQPGVGAVGAKLLFSDGRVQHAGDAVGVAGHAGHMHFGLPREAPGYCDRALLAHEVSAVTAACLMTRRELYRDFGGFDAEHLPVAFNDVDYCLRLRQAGYRVLMTPHAELYHRESATRFRERAPADLARARAERRYMRARWGKVMRHDPYYNPNLNLRRPDFTLGDGTRVDKPWRR